MERPEKSRQEQGIVIIGGGVVGLMTARALLGRGHRPVVIERNRRPREASWSAAGLLTHFPPWEEALTEPLSTQMLQHGHREYRALERELESMDIHTDLGLDLAGCYLDISDSEKQLNAWLERSGEPAERERERFPEFLRSHLSEERRWVYLPGHGGQIRPPRLMEALRHYLSRNRVPIRHETVDAIRPIRPGFEIHSRDDHDSYCSCAQTVLVCAGPWSSRLHPDVQAPGIVPIGGHILRYHLNAAAGEKFILGDSNGRYIVSRGDGVLLAGSNCQDRGYDTTVNAGMIDELKEFAVGLLPILRNNDVEDAWVGLRPMRSDSQWPIICNSRTGVSATTPAKGAKTTAARGLCYLHSGHHRSGIAYAPATAAILADCIDSGTEADFADMTSFPQVGGGKSK